MAQSNWSALSALTNLVGKEARAQRQQAAQNRDRAAYAAGRGRRRV